MKLTKQRKDTIFVIVVITCVLISPLVLAFIHAVTPYVIVKLGDRLFDSLGLYDFGNSLFDTLSIGDSVRQGMIIFGTGIAGFYLLFRGPYMKAKRNNQPVFSNQGKLLLLIVVMIFVLFMAFIILSAKYNT
jgi:hypothetical protein